MWNPPRPGIEPVIPALAGGLSFTAPLGKSCILQDFDVGFPDIEREMAIQTEETSHAGKKLNPVRTESLEPRGRMKDSLTENN